MSADEGVEPPAARVVLVCLAGLALALLAVGVVSGTLVRHVVQILPIVAALLVLMRWPPRGAYAALPIFVFWIFIVTLIWLFLLGVSGIARGHYTAVEILLTLVMAGCSLLGTASSIRAGRPLGGRARVLTLAVFAVLQLAAMRVSFLESMARR